MKTNSSVRDMTALNEAISALELKQELQMAEMRSEAAAIAESLRPSNLVRQILADVLSDKELSTKMKVKATSAAGSLIHEMLVKRTSNPMLRLLGRLAAAPLSRLIERVLNRWM